MNLKLIAGSTNYYLADTALTVFFLLMTIVTIIGAIWLLVKYINVTESFVNATKTLLIVFSAGIAIRIVFALFVTGNRLELNSVYMAISEWAEYGPSEYIRRNYFRTGEYLYPLYYYITGFTAGSAQIAGVDPNSVLMQLIIKLPLILGDAATALLLYDAGRKYLNEYVGAILAALIMLCPVFVFASSVWTSVFSLLTPILLGSFYALVNKKHIIALTLYGFAMLLTREASYLFPVYFVYYGYIWIKSIVKLAKKAGDEKENTLLAIEIPATVACVAIVQYLICLPLTIEWCSGNYFTTIYKIFIYPLTDLKYYADNALSIYNVFMRGGYETDVLFRNQQAVFFIATFAVIITTSAALIYFSKKNRAVLSLIATFTFFILNSMYFDFSVTAMIPCLALMLLSFVLLKDKRLLKIFFGEAFIIICFMCAVFVSAGYYNNFAQSLYFGGTYTGYMQITGSVAGTVIAIMLTVLSLCLLVYTVKVVINISMSEKRSTLGGKESVSLGVAIKDFMKK